MIENRRRMLMAQKKDGLMPSLKGDGKAFIMLRDIVYADRFEIVFQEVAELEQTDDYFTIQAYQDDTHKWELLLRGKVLGISVRWYWGTAGNTYYTNYLFGKIVRLTNKGTANWFQAVAYCDEDSTSKSVQIGTRLTTYTYQYWKLFCDAIKVYSLKIWDGDTDVLKHDLVPYYMGEAGMLDLVDGTFYTNESEEGSFS